MQYIIFGCGVTGQEALHFLGHERVYCFASNQYLDNEYHKREVLNKPVISFDDMKKIYQSQEYQIVVAAERSEKELCEQCRSFGITDYFVFRRDDVQSIGSVYPGYMLNRKWLTVDYNKTLSLYHIERYHKIAIYGQNRFLPYLITEVINQNSRESLCGIVPVAMDEPVRNIGFDIIELNEVWDYIDCLILNVRNDEDAIRSVLEERRHNFDVVDIYSIDRYEPMFYHPELTKYKDIHKGERIFIIGNGSSLSIEDLRILEKNKEVSFGFNGIFKMFDKTTWRPTYLGLCDSRLAIEYKEALAKLDDVSIISTDWEQISSPRVHFDNADYVHCNYQQSFPYKPAFSTDVTYGVADGKTVIYNIGFQFAYYMGAKRIYLIGVDNDMGENNAWLHFTEDYMSKETAIKMKKNDMSPALLRLNLQRTYEKAEEFSRIHGFRIYNATRGGKLEVFERVDFDSLF